MKILFYITSFAILFANCKKQEERTCWKGSGDTVVRTTNLDSLSFNGLELKGGMNYNLIQDSSNYIVINSYENMIDHYSFDVTDSSLVIEDHNKCNFLRDYDKTTEIEIHFTSLRTLNIKGKGKVTNSSPISNEIIHIYSHNANGEIDLNINASSLVIKLINGTLTGSIKGNATSAQVFHFGYSKINFENLYTDYLYIANKSDSDTFVNCSISLVAELLSFGDIYYRGTPSTEIIENTLDSKLIENN